MYYEICKWQVRRKDSEKHLDAIRELRMYQKANRKKFYYAQSRLYTVDDREAKLETWINIDEYRDQQSYNRMFKGYRSSKGVYVEFQRLREKWDSLVVEDSVEVESWIEKPEMIL